MEELEKCVECLHQAFRPKNYFPNIPQPAGWGECYKCKTDEKNKNCAGYTPVTTYIGGKQNGIK
jgi:hypothetical protein